jgi:hypothetical protein
MLKKRHRRSGSLLGRLLSDGDAAFGGPLVVDLPLTCPRNWPAGRGHSRTSSTATPGSHGGYYCHALELYLKALLRQKHSTATVRKFGHRIKLLVRGARDVRACCRRQ